MQQRGRPWWLVAAGRLGMDMLRALVRLVLVPGTLIWLRPSARDRVLISTNRSGDLLLLRGLLDDWMEQHGIRRIILLCDPRYQVLAGFWSNPAVEVRRISSWMQRLWRWATRQHLGYRGDRILVDHWIGQFRDVPFLRSRELFLNRYVEAPGPLRFSPPDRLPIGSDGRAGREDCPEMKRVLLCPQALTVDWPAPEGFWTQLVQALKDRGYSVYTNTAPGETPLPETQPFAHPYERIPLESAYLAGAIGVRSGLMDLLALCRVSLVVLYGSRADYHRFSLRQIPDAPVRKEICWEGAKTADMVRLVLDGLEGADATENS